MDKINFQGLPSTDTPISPSNLNLLQDNIEKAVNTVIVTEANTNLDDYQTEGQWYFASSYTPTNIPVGSNGILKVMVGAGIVKQLWFRHGTANNNDYQTYVRTYTSNTWSNWKRYKMIEEDYYQVGDTEIISRYITGGYISNGATSIRFSIPLSKKMDEVTPTISSGTITVRGVNGGYLLSTANIKDATISVHADSHYLTIYCTYATAFDTANNTPISVNVDDLKIAFT